VVSGSVGIVLIVVLASNAALAQTQYRNLDAGRPVRIEDAQPAARYSFDADAAPFQVERLAGGTSRYRAEPRFGYGVLPFTDLELRVPFVGVVPPRGSGVKAVNGIANASIAATHEFNVETTHVPATAISAELSLPIGNLAPARAAYFAKALLTKTTGPIRVHFNGGAGTYAIRTANSSSGCGAFRITVPGDSICGGPPIIIDAPCRVSPQSLGRVSVSAARQCMPPLETRLPDSAVTSIRSSGSRWFAGLALDHSFPLRSTLVIADVFVERFIGLYAVADWTAEAGLRHQLTPLLVLDAGVSRHFAGTIQATSLSVGATYEVATPPLFGR
jgi:hypothetical protein